MHRGDGLATVHEHIREFKDPEPCPWTLADAVQFENDLIAEINKEENRRQLLEIEQKHGKAYENRSPAHRGLWMKVHFVVMEKWGIQVDAQGLASLEQMTNAWTGHELFDSQRKELLRLTGIAPEEFGNYVPTRKFEDGLYNMKRPVALSTEEDERQRAKATELQQAVANALLERERERAEAVRVAEKNLLADLGLGDDAEASAQICNEVNGAERSERPREELDNHGVDGAEESEGPREEMGNHGVDGAEESGRFHEELDNHGVYGDEESDRPREELDNQASERLHMADKDHFRCPGLDDVFAEAEEVAERLTEESEEEDTEEGGEDEATFILWDELGGGVEIIAPANASLARLLPYARQMPDVEMEIGTEVSARAGPSGLVEVSLDKPLPAEVFVDVQEGRKATAVLLRGVSFPLGLSPALERRVAGWDDSAVASDSQEPEPRYVEVTLVRLATEGSGWRQRTPISVRAGATVAELRGFLRDFQGLSEEAVRQIRFQRQSGQGRFRRMSDCEEVVPEIFMTSVPQLTA